MRLIVRSPKPFLLSLLILALGFAVSPVSDVGASFTAELICEPSYNGAFCEARPIESGYTYSWSTSGYAYKPQPCSGPFCNIACWGTGSGGPGSYSSVTVTISGGGMTDSATRYINCGLN